MDETAFHSHADRTLQDLFDRIDAAFDDVDAELRDGILTLELDDGRQYVINKHAPNREIWLSSPVSGASHYRYDEGTGAWRSTRESAELISRLAEELAQLTGVTAALA